MAPVGHSGARSDPPTPEGAASRASSLAFPAGRGMVAGTPAHLAPEALTNPDRVDHRSDLYAMGAVGFCLLTGESTTDRTIDVDLTQPRGRRDPQRQTETFRVARRKPTYHWNRPGTAVVAERRSGLELRCRRPGPAGGDPIRRKTEQSSRHEG